MPQLYTIAQPSSVDIKRALDIGPCEALVPNVRNANEAHHGVDAADTVPKGIAAEDEEDGRRGHPKKKIRKARFGLI